MNNEKFSLQIKREDENESVEGEDNYESAGSDVNGLDENAEALDEIDENESEGSDADSEDGKFLF